MMLSIRGLYQILAYVYEISEQRTIQKGKLLFPIFFSHRLQPFFYYFHNSHEIKHVSFSEMLSNVPYVLRLSQNFL